MESRERFLATIRREVPDRPPLYLSFTPQMAQKVCDAEGFAYEEPIDSFLSTRISHMGLCTALGADAIGIAATPPDISPTTTSTDGLITNEWGMMFRNAGLYNEFSSFPLAHAETLADIEKYPFFEPNDPSRFVLAREAVQQYKNTKAIIADLECSIFETAWYLTGMEKFLMDIMLEAPYVEALLDRIAYINTETGKELIRAGADVIWCGDDFGSQQSTIMDIDTWRHYFKPRIRKMFDAFRSVNPDIKIAWHSCGAIGSLIPEFIDLGLDILNPIQPLATGMEPEKLKREFGNDLIFFGGICVQNLLPNGTPEKIKEETQRRAAVLGSNGGYIIAPAHNIQPDTPVENVLALCSAVKEI
jgi:uroporphyrinogen decarboxylase